MKGVRGENGKMCKGEKNGCKEWRRSLERGGREDAKKLGKSGKWCEEAGKKE